MPQKAANKRPMVKPEVIITPHHRKAATQDYLSRIAEFLFLSFFRKLRKRKENLKNPVNPVG